MSANTLLAIGTAFGIIGLLCSVAAIVILVIRAIKRR